MLWKKTHTDAMRERADLNAWQESQLHRKEHGRFMYDDSNHPLRSLDLLDNLCLNVGVPQQVLDHATLKDHQHQAPASRLFDLADELLSVGKVQRGVVLNGAPGTGKTTLAAGVVRDGMWAGLVCKMIDWETFAKFHTSWIDLSSNASRYTDYEDRADEWQTEFWRMAAVYEILVVDDIGRSRAPEFVFGEFHALIRQRLANGVLTVVTSNYPAREFEAAIGTSCYEFLKREFDGFTFGVKDTVYGTGE